MASLQLRFLLTIMGAALLWGCASRQDETQQPAGMQIYVDFRNVHRCSRISPEITVMNAPQGTNYYDVRLMEHGPVERLLGGGRWQDDGTGVIPEGALTLHYIGPCPPADRDVEYSYIVSALPKENEQPLAVRLFRFTPE